MSDTAVGYTRLSQDGKSIPEQQQQIRDYCKAEGLELVELFNDGQQASGYTTEREEYQALLNRLDGGDVSHVIVRGLSRLSRDRKHRMKLLLELDERGVDIHAVERGDRNPIDLDEPWALTREAGQADADDVEKRKEARRGRKEAERRVEEGLPNGRPPIGLRYDENKERLVPGEEYETAVDVLEMLDDGHSYREIAAELPVSRTQVGTIKKRRSDYLQATE